LDNATVNEETVMRVFVLVAVALASLSLASIACSGASSDESAPSDEPATSDGASEEVKAAVIDESANGKTVSVPLGKSFTIALADNAASTGYEWRVKSVDRTIGQPKESYTPGDVHRPGSPGLKKFTWSTSSPLNLVGSHVIVLEKARSFGNDPPAATFKVTVEIKDVAASQTCGGFRGQSCAPGYYCNFTAAAGCGFADQTGKCDARPELCPAVIIPVCGCDGKTYNNSCEANRAGVDVHTAGQCAH
jgi:predicted secreted protein